MESFDPDVTKSVTGKGLNIERYDMSIYQTSLERKGSANQLQIKQKQTSINKWRLNFDE